MRILSTTLVAAAVLGLAGCTSGSVFSSGSFTSALTVSTGSVNAVRAQHGLNRLKSDPRLVKMAREQASLMARHLKMSHTTSYGQSFSRRLKRSGYNGLAAENLAEGFTTVDQVIAAWLNSRGHRRNMLHKRMTHYGLAVVEADHPKRGKRKYWALVLGG